MTISIISVLPPPILQYFNNTLLSTPVLKFDANYIKELVDIILRKLCRGKFSKLSKSKNNVYLKYLKFMELYEQAKTKEKDSKGKTLVKANAIFYRTRLPNQNDRAIFERLVRRR